jgi:hypothetical protein
MRAVLAILCLALVGCGDRTFTITAPDVTVIATDVTAKPEPVPPQPAPDPLPPAVDTFGPWNPDEPFNEDDAIVDPPCEKPGKGSGNGNGKGQGDEKACK